MRFILFLFLVSLVSCSVQLDENDKERIRKDELVYVETDNRSELNDFIFGLIFMSDRSNRDEVLIVKIDGIKTKSGVMVDNQQFGILPGKHTFEIVCNFSTKDDDQGVTYRNQDILDLDLKPGHKYVFSSVRKSSSCAFEVKEEKLKGYKLK